MNTDIPTTSKSALAGIATAKTVNKVKGIPMNTLRSTGSIFHDISCAFTEFRIAYAAAHAEIKEAKRDAREAIADAKRRLKAEKRENKIQVKTAKLLAQDNVNTMRTIVSNTRKVSKRIINAAAERAAGQSGLQKIEREIQETQERIDFYEAEVERLEDLLDDRIHDATPVTTEIEVDEELEEEEIPPREGMATVIKDAGTAANAVAETSEIADAPPEAVGAGVPLKDEGEDDKL